MSAMASQITSLTIVCATVYSGVDQRKHQSSASLVFVRGSQVTGEFPAQKASNAEMFPFDDVIMRTVTYVLPSSFYWLPFLIRLWYNDIRPKNPAVSKIYLWSKSDAPHKRKHVCTNNFHKYRNSTVSKVDFSIITKTLPMVFPLSIPWNMYVLVVTIVSSLRFMVVALVPCLVYGNLKFMVAVLCYGGCHNYQQPPGQPVMTSCHQDICVSLVGLAPGLHCDHWLSH